MGVPSFVGGGGGWNILEGGRYTARDSPRSDPTLPLSNHFRIVTFDIKFVETYVKTSNKTWPYFKLCWYERFTFTDSLLIMKSLSAKICSHAVLYPGVGFQLALATGIGVDELALISMLAISTVYFDIKSKRCWYEVFAFTDSLHITKRLSTKFCSHRPPAFN